MDLTSVLRDEIFRPTVTIVSPGAIAATPWIVLAFLSSPKLRVLAAPHAALVSSIKQSLEQEHAACYKCMTDQSSG